LNTVGVDQPALDSTRVAGTTPPTRRPFVSVVVPAFNEALILMQSLTTIHEYMSLLDERYRWEIIVVNDGSTDETGAIAELFASTHSGVRVLHHVVNFQLGQALRYAFNSCSGDYVVTLDCDLSYGPYHIELLLDALRTGHAKIAIASPYMRGGQATNIPVTRRVLSRGANGFLSLAAAGRLSTLTGMVRAYDRPFLTSLSLRSVGTEINTEIVYKAQLLGARIVEVPAHLDWPSNHDTGSPRRSHARLGRSVSSYAFSGFLFRPIAFFLVPGIVLLLLSLIEVGWIGFHTVSHMGGLSGSLDHRLSVSLAMTWQESAHSYVIGGVSLILAVQIISLGILSAQNKRYFEEVFLLGTSISRAIGRTTIGGPDDATSEHTPRERPRPPSEEPRRSGPPEERGP
jgi:glycosyltransferase involved in cell wall biosynthesis